MATMWPHGLYSYAFLMFLMTLILGATAVEPLPPGFTKFGRIKGPADGYTTKTETYLAYKLPRDKVLYRVDLYFSSTKSMWLQLWAKESNDGIYALSHQVEVKSPGPNKTKLQYMDLGNGMCPLISGDVYLGLWSPGGDLPIPYRVNQDFITKIDKWDDPNPPDISRKRMFEVINEHYQFLLVGYVYPQSAAKRRKRTPSAPCPLMTQTTRVPTTTTSPSTTTVGTTPRPSTTTTTGPTTTTTLVPGGGAPPGGSGDQPQKGDNKPIYIGVGVGAGVLLIIINIVVCCVLKRRSTSKGSSASTKPAVAQSGHTNQAYIANQGEYERPQPKGLQPQSEYTAMPPRRESGQYEEITDMNISPRSQWTKVLPQVPHQPPRDYENTESMKKSETGEYVPPSQRSADYLQPTPYARGHGGPKPKNGRNNKPSEGYVDMNKHHHNKNKATNSAPNNKRGGTGNVPKNNESTYLELMDK